ncbi:transporter substrate-binding domain-containing protein [Paenibacillus sp.]|jgi:putative lysine transport system substrate-binding protein|uniref:transporter substrate-binding domain-containing protein n=1 Tax=Paenibacillus sp. TaxID=58172 RepID=UPI0028186ADB|nr:transporter substrate-binding domain-containing protein [Paenibacillus sp.]MDR0267952.1 transporter substrate-binding domain-containing protein [Paenibacillus sp.]
MKLKTRLFSVMLLSAMIIVSGCGAKDAKDAKGDTFKVGMEAGYPPFNWTQKDNSNGAVAISGTSEYAGGYDVEIAKKIADSLGKKLEIVKTEWDGLVPSLTSGTIDAIIAGMSPTAERKQTIDFSDIYYKSNLVMVVKKGGPYEGATSIQDFKGAKITAQLNTFHYSVIDQINGISKQTAMDNFPAMRVALESGMIDGYVSERPEAVSASAANDKFAMVEFKDGFKTSEDDTAIAVGVKKNSEYTAKINEILKGISEEQRTNIMDEAIKNQPAADQ